MLYSFARMEWRTDDRDMQPGFWSFPHDINGREAEGGIDMRPLPAQGVAGGVPAGFAFVASRDTIPGGYAIGGRLDSTLTSGRQQTMEDMLGLPRGALRPSATPLDVLRDALTLHGDPTGQTRWKPLMPTRDLFHEIWFGEHGCLWQGKFHWNDYAGDSVRGVLRHDFARLKQQCLGPLQIHRWLKHPGWDHYRRVLGGLVLKYNVPAEQIIPGEVALPPETSFSDDFDRANESLDASANWTEVLNDLDIESNEVVNPVDDNNVLHARCEVPVSSVDHFAQCDCKATGTSVGFVEVCARYAAAADTCYTGGHRSNAATTYVIRKNITGVETTLATASGADPGNIFQLAKLDVRGSSLELFIEGSSKVTDTDTAITEGLRGGLRGNPTAARRGHWNDFIIDDGISAVAAAAPAGMISPWRGV